LNKKQYSKKCCYICGKFGANSKDHVPPQGIYLKELKNIGNDLMTVPAHSQCNGGFSKDDEYFRFFLSIPSYWTNETARKLWKSKVISGLHKLEATIFRKSLLSLMEPVEIKTKSGIILGKSEQIKIDAERIDRIIERIVRGIYYYETKTIMPLTNQFQINFIEPKDNFLRNNSLFGFKEKIFGGDTFKFWWKKFDEPTSTSAFSLSFFNSVEFLVFSFDEKDI